MTTTFAVELRGVSARYGAHGAGPAGGVADAPEKMPLRGVDLGVSSGELVAVLGANGAGKSTLLRVMSGALAPAAGEVRLFGEVLSRAGEVVMERRDVARRVAIVGQREEVAFRFSVRDVVAMGRAPHQGAWQRAADRDRAIVDDAMKRCDLTGLADRAVDELSGGEQRRVAIARALAQEPRVLLLDEPAAFLDVRHQIDLYELLSEEVSRRELACVVVMHELNVAAQYASRIALAKGGEIVAAGEVKEVMTWARLRDVFDADLYCGVNDLTGDRFFLPMRKRAT